MQIFEGEYLQAEKKQVADVYANYNGPHSVDTPNRQLGHFLR